MERERWRERDGERETDRQREGEASVTNHTQTKQEADQDTPHARQKYYVGVAG